MIRSVESINGKSSDSTELKKKKCNEQRYYSCPCPDFENNRMICKHFFAVIEGNLIIFPDYLG